MTAPTTVTVESLDSFDLRLAAEIVAENIPAAVTLLEGDSHFTQTAAQLIELAQLKENDDRRKHEDLQRYLAAEKAYNDAVEALTQALMSDMTRVGSRRKQAEKLLQNFDIAPKA